MTHAEQEICLKEEEWKDVRDFISGTREYRVHLDKSLDAIKNITLGAIITVLIPSVYFWVQLGEMKRQVQVNTDRLAVIEKVIWAK